MRGLEGGIWTKYHSCVATRQVPTLPRQHSPGVSGESQTASWERTSVFASLAGDLHCHGHQAHPEETRGGSDPAHDPGNPRTSRAAAGAVARRKRAQHRFYRALEWNHATATGQLDAQMSSRRSPPASAGDGDVLGFDAHQNSVGRTTS